ncbi:MAG: nucleotide disphospho-sugar-binding domain-containing protein, partial [Pseudomonadota bacterium]
DTSQNGTHAMAKQDLHKAFSLMWHRVDQSNRIVFDLIKTLARPGCTTLVGSTLALGTRLAQEKLKLPLATVHLSPACFLSSIKPPVFKSMRVPDWLPLSAKKAIWWLIERAVLDPVCTGGLNRFRAELGLPPVQRVMSHWLHSPQLVIALFEPWFCQPQADWPQHTELAGFPRFDKLVLADSAAGVPPELQNFLLAGQAPIVFMTGSAMSQAKPFFANAVQACRQLGTRGILLTRHLAQVPDDLPGFMHHASYAPLSEVLPQAAALVSHGGIGTLVQGMTAGVPQLVMPYAHDQYDNAARITSLGLGSTIQADSSAEKMAEALQKLLTSTQVSKCNADIAARLQNPASAAEQVLNRACKLIESLR